MVVARPTTILSLVAIVATIGPLLVLAPVYAHKIDLGATPMVLPVGGLMLGMGTVVLLKSPALVREGSVRSCLPQRPWIAIAEPGQLVLTGGAARHGQLDCGQGGCG